MTDYIEKEESYFEFVFGQKYLLDKKYRIRNPMLLEKIGISKGHYIVIGADQNDIYGFEDNFLPIKKFTSLETEHSPSILKDL